MSIKAQAKKFMSSKLTFFTGVITEIQGTVKPTKNFIHPKGWQKLTASDCKLNKITSADNGIALVTGEVSGNIILIDWDLKKWNSETKQFEDDEERIEKYMECKEAIGEIDTYTEETCNGGMHWIYKYDPIKMGFKVKSKNDSLIYKGVICGDIKCEGGLCYISPTYFTGLDGSIKEYKIDNDSDIKMMPDILYTLLPFEKYEEAIKIKPKAKPKKATVKPIEVNNEVVEVVEVIEVVEVVEVDDVFKPITQLITEEDYLTSYLMCIDYNNFDDWLKVCFFGNTKPEYKSLIHKWAKHSVE